MQQTILANSPTRFSYLAEGLRSFVQQATGQHLLVEVHKQYVGGFSWQTYGITVTGADQPRRRELILRVGHEQGLLSPYSALPEYLALTSLATSAVAVPEAIWHSDDPSFLGAPFLVVAKAAGVVHLPFGPKAVAEGADKLVGEQFVSALAALHNFDWSSSPARALAPIVTAENAAVVQVARWEDMIRASGARPLPLLHHAIGWLKRNTPVAPRVCIVHGDFRAGNFLQDDSGITAILDWELVHLGDPHEDIAWASLKFLSGGSDWVSGLVPRDTFTARYEAATGLALSSASLRWYEALALVKICAMNLKAAGRVESGKAPDLRMSSMGFGLPRLQLELTRLVREEP